MICIKFIDNSLMDHIFNKNSTIQLCLRHNKKICFGSKTPSNLFSFRCVPITNLFCQAMVWINDMTLA